MASETFGWISLVIRSEKMSLDIIQTITHTKPTRFTLKDSGRSFKATKDTWIYKEEYRVTDDMLLSNEIEKAMKNFLCKFENVDFSKLKEISDEIYVTIYISSNNSQIGFVANNDLMARLFNLNIDVEFSILSMGEVDDI